MLGCGLQLLLLFLLVRPHDYQVTQCYLNQFSERRVDLNHNYCHVVRKFLKTSKTVTSQVIWYCSLLYIDLLSKCCDFYVFSLYFYVFSLLHVNLYPFGIYLFPDTLKVEFAKFFTKDFIKLGKIKLKLSLGLGLSVNNGGATTS